MKTNQDYWARVQECMLLFLTNAAFLIDLSIKAERNSAILYLVAESYEECAQKIFEILSCKDGAHLNPALRRKTTGESVKDFENARSDAIRFHRLLILFSAYAPDPASRKLFMNLSLETQRNIRLLKSIS